MKLDPSEITRVYIQYDSNAPLNYSGSVTATIQAVNNDGEESDITTHNKLDVESERIEFKDGRMFIKGRPDGCGNDSLPVRFTITYKQDSASYTDYAVINHRGPMIIDESGTAGEPGKNGKNRSMGRLIGRSGKPGEDGEDGQNGLDGPSLTIHIWKEDNALMARVLDNQTYEAWCYKSITDLSCAINVSGGNGGDGGSGGDGSDGKDGEVDADNTKLPGSGGDAGDGGDGGNGGNAGNVVVFLHTNAADVEQQLTAMNNPGFGGIAGNPGTPGNGGDGASGQTDGLDGTVGLWGNPGTNGSPGPAPTVTIQEFNFENFYYRERQ